ncbi:hypothetical protein EVAR_60373_1 [Eumeta japonica]|uniref:Uncharacterized protein n=1 Tax=Eumeta variegata TaxID=151549 RepID=A0A4C1ZQ38_EUMVA|nr:hypothetical protein EVAR_60373_1 [Eumeta japonica]
MEVGDGPHNIDLPNEVQQLQLSHTTSDIKFLPQTRLKNDTTIIIIDHSALVSLPTHGETTLKPLNDSPSFFIRCPSLLTMPSTTTNREQQMLHRILQLPVDAQNFNGKEHPPKTAFVHVTQAKRD